MGVGTALFRKVKLVSLLMLRAGNGAVVFSVISQVKDGVTNASGKSPLALHCPLALHSVSRCALHGGAYECSSGPAAPQHDASEAGSSCRSRALGWRVRSPRWTAIPLGENLPENLVQFSARRMHASESSPRGSHIGTCAGI